MTNYCKKGRVFILFLRHFVLVGRVKYSDNSIFICFFYLTYTTKDEIKSHNLFSYMDIKVVFTSINKY